MKKRKLFIAGTDTGVGKTCVATMLLRRANALGYSTAAFKPVAAGCEKIDGEWRNEDALCLQQACSLPVPYEQINPVALPAAVSPHIAAQKAGRKVSIDRLLGFSQGALNLKADLILIEGAGGWRTPINEREFLSALPKQMQWPVLLVVGVRLGCLNHAALTVEAILKDGLSLAGWVANTIDPEMPCQQENIATLKAMLPAPCIGVVPYEPLLQVPVSDDVNTASNAFAGDLDMELLINRLDSLN